jgi:hypothetical protein
MRRFFLLIIALSMILGCASTTTINTYPQGAKVKVNGEFIGISPIKWEDHYASWVGIEVVASKDGYQDAKTIISKDNFYLGRLFWVPVLSWPWITGYRDQYTIELIRDKNAVAAAIPPPPERMSSPPLDKDQWNRIFLTSDQLPVNIKYEVIKTLEVSGGWYGKSDDALQWLADEARAAGANAVIEVKTWHQPTGGSWAVPHGTGIAIRIIVPGKVDYSRLNGTWK